MPVRDAIKACRWFIRGAVVLATFLAAGHAWADQWRPCPDRRVSSPSGKHYLLVRGEMGEHRAGDFELVRRREGAPPLPAAERWRDGPESAASEKAGTPPAVEVDPKDEVLAHGNLRQLPVEIRVLDKEPGAVLYDQWGGLGGASVLGLMDKDGSFRWALSLGDLFARKTIEKFSRTTSSIGWCSTWWVDEGRGKIVLVGGLKDLYLEVSLADGSREFVENKVLLTRIEAGPEAERMKVLEVAASDPPPGLAQPAKKVAEDPKQPVSVRLRAAVAAKAADAVVDITPVFLEAAKKGQPPVLRQYAIAHCADVLGEKAIPILRDALREPTEKEPQAWYGAMEGFTRLGEKAVPTLLEILKEKAAPPDYRGGAAHILGNIRSPKAFDGLMEAAADETEYVANAAINAAIETGTPDLEKRLLDLLRKGSTQDSRIASWIEQHPTPAAVDPLLLALERTKPDTFDRTMVLEALRKVTGKDFGVDPEAWRKGVGGK